MNAAAIILAAGKGTRMGAAPINKVCFDCAGTPVIRRIVENFRAGGVSRIVVVVGHRAESVMGALADFPGVLYAYQTEQRGTGHAALCGLNLLEDIGFSGPVVISVGDRIVGTSVVRGLLDRAGSRLAVWGAQPVANNPGGGRIVETEGRPRGVVERFDIGLMSVLPLPAAERAAKLAAMGFSPKKAAQILEFARQHPDAPTTRYGLAADEMLAARYANCSLYCFDLAAALRVLRGLKSDNVQGELYITDALEVFADENAVEVFPVESADDMLTYSTRLELRDVARRFMHTATALGKKSKSGVEGEGRMANLLSAFVEKYGDRPCILSSAPGRINLMGRHIEHRGGSTNYMATNQRLTFVVAPREDDIVHIANLDPAFPEAEFRIGEGKTSVENRCAKDAASSTAAWLDFLDAPETKAELASTRGHWMNYVKGAVLRFQAAVDLPLCGMDILASGNIPIAAGLSSSSALVVATAEAIVALNELNLTTREFVDLCGEGEWFVGSRGGAGDHAAMKCAKTGCVTHLKFKPFEIGEIVPFPKGYAVLVVQSGEQAKKSEGARDVFNARIRDYEAALAEVKRRYPALPLAYFRDLAFLPEQDRQRALDCLKDLPSPIPGVRPATTPYGVALFGINECRRAEACLTLLTTGNYAALGEMMKESHDGDRIGNGQYECSTPRIDALCDRLNAVPGVLGSQLVGAGLGGCVIALVEEQTAPTLVAGLARDGYESFVSTPSAGSRVEW